MTSDERIYLDYHATTPVDPRVADVVLHYMTKGFGNANSSDHIFGDEAEAAVKNARQCIARLLNAEAARVVFTSGATESVSLALTGLVERLRALGLERALRVAVSRVEHQAVLRVCERLAQRGEIVLDFLGVDSKGRVDLAELERMCKEGQDLVCLMTANNEVGNIFPVSMASQIARHYGAFFFTDATQAVGKIPVDFSDWQLDALALSAHKFYGPKGVGALLLSERFPIQTPASDKQLRAGTPNVPGIAGVGEAAHLRYLEMTEDSARVGQLRDRLQTLLLENFENLVINGDVAHRLPGNLHISIPGIPNQALMGRIRHRVAISTGAACSSGIEAPSHVLEAMDLPAALTSSALRFGLGKYTTRAEIETVTALIYDEVSKIRSAAA